MNFDLSEEEEMLKALAERFVTDRYDLDRRRTYLASDTGFSDENWALLGELGLTAALFDADDGGLGIGSVGLATVFEALGHGLVVEPLIESLAVAGGIFAVTASSDLKQAWMDDLISGSRRLVLAHREEKARRNLGWVETQATSSDDGVVLSGSKSLVPAGEGVDAYIVSARAPDSSDVALYLVAAGSPGLTVRPWRSVDGSVAVSVTLDGVHVPAAHVLSGGMADIEAGYTRGALLQSAEAVGIMQRLLTDTLDYLRTRKQFGSPLGSFQALQHRMVAQYAALEQSRALLDLAMMADPSDRATWTRTIYGARAYIAEASVTLGHEMIQMHGGMGVTDELVIGHGHKRLLMLSRWPVDADTALDRYASAV